MQRAFRLGWCGGWFAVSAVTCACGGGSALGKCAAAGVQVTVAPLSASADHSAAPPGNQVQFIATAAPTAPPGCPLPEWIARVYAAWSNPDPADITIGSANDSTNGMATCKAPTRGAVTLTGTFSSAPLDPNQPVTRSVQLTCE